VTKIEHTDTGKILISSDLVCDFTVEYALDDNIGKGAFASVYKGIMNDEEIAIKIIDKKELSKAGEDGNGGENLHERAVAREIALYKDWIPIHRNIVKFRRFHQDDENFYLVLEFCKGGDLQTKLNQEGPFSEGRAQLYFSQIMEAIGALHLNVTLDKKKNRPVQYPICYRDLKPENVMLMEDAETIKLIDFNTAKVSESTIAETFCGSFGYADP